MSSALHIERLPGSAVASWWSLAGLRHWAVRVVLSAPPAALAWWAWHQSYISVPHAELEVRGDLARASTDLQGLRWAYPPLPILLASTLAGGALALGLVSSFLAGCSVERAWNRLAERGVSAPLAAVLLASVLALPATWYVVTQDLAGLAGLALLVIALTGFVRFVTLGETRGGFVAGLALGVAFGCDPVAVVYAAALGVSAPFLAHERYRGRRSAAVATAAVLVFPAAAGALGWAFLEWRFTGGAFGTLRATLLRFPDGVLPGLRQAIVDAGADVLRSPVYLAVAVLLVARRRPAVVAVLVPVVGLVMARWIGLDYPAALATMLLGLLAVMTAPSRPRKATATLLVATAGLQVVIGVVAPADPGVVHHFLDVLR